MDDVLFSRSYQQQTGAQMYFCLCPNANVYISGMLPQVQMFVDQNCKMVLGTDSLASNDQLDILAEISTLQQNFPAIKKEKWLQMATLNGAEALGIGDTYGSFDINKKPGVIFIKESNGRFSAERIV